MKQRFSIFLLSARSSIYKVLVILLGMAAVQTGAFLFVLSRGVTENGMSLEGVIETSRASWVFLLAFLLITVILFSIGYDAKGRRSYTLFVSRFPSGRSSSGRAFITSAYSCCSGWCRSLWRCFFVPSICALRRRNM